MTARLWIKWLRAHAACGRPPYNDKQRRTESNFQGAGSRRLDEHCDSQHEGRPSILCVSRLLQTSHCRTQHVKAAQKFSVGLASLARHTAALTM